MVESTRSAAELGAFLRARREALPRSDHGLPPAARGRTVGVRREEVAVLSGISVTWYTWLEQGRNINPSPQVIAAVARVLRLDEAGCRYVHALAGLPFTPVIASTTEATIPAHLQHLLDALGDNPSFALTPNWHIAGWNAAYAELYPGVASFRAEDRNLIRLVFTDHSVRTLLNDWPETSRRFLGEFRAETAARPGDAALYELVEGLSHDSAEFRDGWERYDVRGFESRERVFHHPAHGTIHYEQHQLRPSDQPLLQIVVYTDRKSVV